MTRGLYVIFEGSEGTGKTSTMRAVAEHLQELNPILTHHPGSTPLGAHLRQLVKYPHTIAANITIDPLARQCLYMADSISFLESILKPALGEGRTVFADRSTFISSMIYGTADNIDDAEIYKLLRLIDPPRADRLYVMQCPWRLARDRIRSSRQDNADHYDNESDDFFMRVEDKYSKLSTGPVEQLLMVSRVVPLDNVVYIDSSRPQEQVVEDVVKDLKKYISHTS